tara:strand:+ start:701 stop:943 length:243 start_codon:yes stop_codon:yes gene_type:complete
MKEKNLPPDNDLGSIDELTNQANQIIDLLENEKDLNNSIESYQKLIKLNNIIEKKFHKEFKSIINEASKKVKDIKKNNEE